MRSILRYLLLSVIPLVSIKGQSFASTKEFIEDYQKSKNSQETVLKIRSNLENYYGPVDTDFTKKLGHYLSTGNIEGENYHILDRKATKQELENLFKLFLASAFRGEKLSQVFAEQLDKHTDKKIRDHIQGAQFFAKMAEDFYLNLGASEKKYKDDYGFNPAEISRIYHDLSSDFNSIRQKNEDWHEAIKYIIDFKAKNIEKQLDQKFKLVAEKVKTEIWKRSQQIDFHIYEDFRDFEDEFVKFFYDNIDKDKIILTDDKWVDLASLDDRPLSIRKTEILNQAKMEDLEILSEKSYNFSDSTVLSRLSTFSLFSKYINQFNYNFLYNKIKIKYKDKLGEELNEFIEEHPPLRSLALEEYVRAYLSAWRSGALDKPEELKGKWKLEDILGEVREKKGYKKDKLPS